MRTVFNLLGPLTNPARPAYFLLGVFDPGLLRPMAEALRALGVRRALVVHGEGADELILGENRGVELIEGELRDLTLTPEDVGLGRAPIEALRGGTPEENARLIRRILAGEEAGPPRDVVALNAGAALYAAEKAQSLAEGVEKALEVLGSGTALEKLEALVGATRAARG